MCSLGMDRQLITPVDLQSYTWDLPNIMQRK
jgi:hypothetical protein